MAQRGLLSGAWFSFRASYSVQQRRTTLAFLQAKPLLLSIASGSRGPYEKSWLSCRELPAQLTRDHRIGMAVAEGLAESYL